MAARSMRSGDCIGVEQPGQHVVWSDDRSRNMRYVGRGAAEAAGGERSATRWSSSPNKIKPEFHFKHQHNQLRKFRKTGEK